MTNAKSTVEIEVCPPQNRRMVFRPLGPDRRVRGRIDFSNLKGDRFAALREKWEEPIPGQVIGINVETGEGYIREPLRDEEHRELAREIEQQPFRLPPERQAFPNANVANWVHWMRRAVEAGTARIVGGGKLPDPAKCPGQVEQHFAVLPPEASQKEDSQRQLADAISAMAAAIDRLTESQAAQSRTLATLVQKGQG